MRPLALSLAFIASAALTSACASDYGGSRYARCGSSGDEVAGAAVGGGLGALAGSAIAGRGDRTEGAVIGGVAGAVVGSQVAKSNDRCFYYDESGRVRYR